MSSLGNGAPDIAVGLNGQTFLFEIKDGSRSPSQQALTEKEKQFFDSWKGHVDVLRGTLDVIKFMDSVKV